MKSASSGGPKPPSLSKALNLAKRWALEAGSSVDLGIGTSNEGKDYPIIILDKNTLPAIVRDSGKRLVIAVQLPVPGELRDKLRSAEDSDKLEFMVNLRGLVTANPRLGFMFIPPTARLGDEIELVVLERGVRISDEDLSSYDRFFDSVTEVRTGALKIAWFLGLGAPTPKTPPVYTASTPAPPDIYR